MINGYSLIERTETENFNSLPAHLTSQSVSHEGVSMSMLSTAHFFSHQNSTFLTNSFILFACDTVGWTHISFFVPYMKEGLRCFWEFLISLNFGFSSPLVHLWAKENTWVWREQDTSATNTTNTSSIDRGSSSNSWWLDGVSVTYIWLMTGKYIPLQNALLLTPGERETKCKLRQGLENKLRTWVLLKLPENINNLI